MSVPPSTGEHWLIWDGDCNFCGNAVNWFGNLDRDHHFTIVPAQVCPRPPMTPALEDESTRSMIVITGDGQQIFGGKAVLHVLEQVGWHPGLMKLLGKPPFVWAVTAGYRIVANNRQFFSRVLFPGQSGCQVRYRRHT